MKKAFALIVALAIFFSTSNIYSTTNDLAGIASGGCEGQNPSDPTSVMPASNETAAQQNQHQIIQQNEILQLQQNQNITTQQNLSAPAANNVLVSSQAQEMTPYDYEITASIDPFGLDTITLTITGNEAVLKGKYIIDDQYREISGLCDPDNGDPTRKTIRFNLSSADTDAKTLILVNVKINVNTKTAVFSSISKYIDSSFIDGCDHCAQNEESVHYSFFPNSPSELSSYQRTLKKSTYDAIGQRIKFELKMVYLSVINSEYNYIELGHAEREMDRHNDIDKETSSRSLSIDIAMGSNFTKIESFDDQKNWVLLFEKIRTIKEKTNLSSTTLEQVKNRSGVFEDRAYTIERFHDDGRLMESRTFITMGLTDWKNNDDPSDPKDVQIIKNHRASIQSQNGGCESSSEYIVDYGVRFANAYTLKYGLVFINKSNTDLRTFVDYPKQDTVEIDGTTYKISIKYGKVSLKRYIPENILNYANRLQQSLPDQYVFLSFDTGSLYRDNRFFVLNILPNSSYSGPGNLTHIKLLGFLQYPDSTDPAFFYHPPSEALYGGDHQHYDFANPRDPRPLKNFDLLRVYSAAEDIARSVNPGNQISTIDIIGVLRHIRFENFITDSSPYKFIWTRFTYFYGSDDTDQDGDFFDEGWIRYEHFNGTDYITTYYP